MENWKTHLIELNRLDIDDIAQHDGGDNMKPTPYIGHNYRTRNEIEDGTIRLINITDGGVMIWTIIPFDPKRKKKYKQYELALQFENWAQIVSDPELDTKTKVLTLIKNSEGQSDELKFHCTCPSFKYHYQYVTDQHGAAIFSQPDPGLGIANPNQKGIACKHARRIVSVFPAYYAEIFKKIRELEKG